MSLEPRDVSLLSSEWQGYGVDSSVQEALFGLVAALFADSEFLHVPALPDEPLEVEGGVLGLSSIAGRLWLTIDGLDAREPERIFHLGGTCGSELAPVAWLNERYAGDLAVVWLDAHGDLNTPASSPSGHFHGMVLRTLLGDGPPLLVEPLPRILQPAQVCLAGTRDLDPPEASFVDHAGLTVVGCDDLSEPRRLVQRLRSAGFRQVYAHLDVDVLDPDVFPHTLMQTPGGVTPAEAAAVVRAVGEAFDLVGFSLVEYVKRSEQGPDQMRRLLRETGVRIGALGDLSAY